MADHLPDGPDTVRVPFIFVKHGDPPPLEWMARHPDWVKIPAVMIPRNSPHHPANGGPYPTFQAPPPVAKAAPVAEAEHWPLGRPASTGLRGAMSRLKPGGGPPRYPGGLGAPPGSFPGVGGDPVAAFLRANAVLDRVTGAREAAPQGAPTQLAQSVAVSSFNAPLPDVFQPGTTENEDFVRSVGGAARSLKRAVEGVFQNKTDEKPGSGKATSVDDLLAASSHGRKTKGGTALYGRPGGIKDAESDFDSLQPKDTRADPDKPEVRIGILPDGRTLTVRPGSTDSRPTLEIYNPKNGRSIKIRYGAKNE